MFRSIFKSFISSVVVPITRAIRRWAYNFDGVDDHGVLATRAINPDGDNTYKFYTPSNLSARQHIITQSDTATLSSAEFLLYVLSGTLFINRGGTISNLGVVNASTKYTIEQVGDNISIYQAGVFLRLVVAGSGVAREPTAPTRISVRSSSGSLVNFFAGIQRDIEINGVLWQIATRNSATQASTPAGNTMTLVNTTSDRWQEVPQ